ncbi:MAG: hypothetical protein V2A74_09965 [bacterium]
MARQKGRKLLLSMVLAGFFLLLLAVFHFLSVPQTSHIPDDLKLPPKEFDRWINQEERREVKTSTVSTTEPPMPEISEEEAAKMVVFPDDITTRSIQQVLHDRYVRSFLAKLSRGEKSRAAEIYPELRARYLDLRRTPRKENLIDGGIINDWLWRREHPSAELLDLVREYRSLANLAHEFSRSQDLPMLDYEGERTCEDLGSLLCASAYAELEDGNTSEAVQRAIDPLFLAEYASAWWPWDYGTRLQGYTIFTLSSFLEIRELPASDLSAIRQSLADHLIFNRDLTPWLAESYKDDRGQLFAVYEQIDPYQFVNFSDSDRSISVSVFGMDIPNIPAMNFGGVMILNPFNRSARAYYRFHRDFQMIVKAYDEYWKLILEASEKPYPECPRLPYPPEVLPGWMGRTDYARVRIECLTFDTRLNLLRAGVELLLDPASTESAQGKDYWQDRANPWRDPFTEKSLVVAGTEDERIIYSLGPDLVDQHGELIYDPTNGVASAGDLVLRLAKPKKDEK